MTSSNKNKTLGTASRIKNYALFEFLPETVLECCGLVEWPVSQTFADIENAVVMFVFFVVKVAFASSAIVTDVKGVKVSPGFRLMSMRIINLGFGNGMHKEGVLPRKSQAPTNPKAQGRNQNGFERNCTGEPVQGIL